MASILLGWVLTREGQLDEGIAQMRRGLAAQLATGADLNRPYWRCLIAEACLHGRRRQPTRWRSRRRRSRSRRDAGERDWEAEIHRLRGRAAAGRPEPAIPKRSAGRSSFRRALDVARRQAARSLELRAAMSLSRLWQARAEDAGARTPGAHLSWFTEGLDTPDLREANELRASSAPRIL